MYVCVCVEGGGGIGVCMCGYVCRCVGVVWVSEKERQSDGCQVSL